MTQIYNIFCQISHFCRDLANYQIIFQHTHQIPPHILIDFTVAGEGAAAFFVAAEGADQVRILNLFVEVTDKAAAGQVGGCDFVERADFLLAGGWITDYYRTTVLCLAWNILYTSIDDISLCHLELVVSITAVCFSCLLPPPKRDIAL